MKKLYGLLLSTLFCATASAAELPEKPQDYARGVMLDVPQPASWYRVDLPQEVYAHSAWPDLRDVRVFNHDGERVPFALETQNTKTVAPEAVPLRVFPLDATPVSGAAQQENIVRLQAPSGVEIRIEGDASKPVGKSYLLVLPPDLPDTFRLGEIKLGWQESSQNWRSRASVLVSHDMRSWDTLLDDAPVMALASGNDKLKLDRIQLPERQLPDGGRYLLLVFDTPDLPVTLTEAMAMPGREPAPLEKIQMAGNGRQVSPTEAQYQWPQPQPFRSLSVEFHEDVVLPVEIAIRRTATSAWQPLTKTVLWQRNGQRSVAVELAGETVQAVRITTLDARLPNLLPQVYGSRDRLALVFNAQGKEPFILAWGNKAAQPAAVTPDTLIPQELRKQLDPTSIPDALPGDKVTLGGEARMTATPLTEQEGKWKRLLVWGVLVLGVAVLAWMAIRIWREAQSR
ncbi:DUF3999 domain-containing protein [Kosakonia sp. SMBL-WEM22]|uniref:DUF3999 domain-containing protein n=1 Tax=Kosakonia sp. SMBL-WEM22 TaxID=2725560 RepID=UPI001659415D|nr:DUF3999 domain-containing protein [Kosakonia sp. SMBL-WEM22]MDV5355450.1 DUF3999 domain-containing protein [Enterobacter asburiae]QNQ19234.1 DUF3999 domain-containing protein [Kosakonia sp. SMBL-WEM22]